MEKERFESLKLYFEAEGYANLVSWAVWNEQDIYDLSIFDENHLGKTLPMLQEDIVIVGLNACDINNEMETWEGFHYKHKGGRDSWLRDLVQLCNELEGAYMTDVFKIPVSKSSCLREIVKSDFVRNEQFDALEKELNQLGDNLTIVLIGNDAERYFKRFIKEKDKTGQYRLFKIPHYAARISKNTFINDAKKRLEEL